MKAPKNPSSQMKLFGYVLLAAAASLFIHETVAEMIFLRPINISVVMAYTTIGVVALLAFQVGRCFKILEDKLDKN